MHKILIAFLILCTGFVLGKWDTKYGYSAGLKIGNYVRNLLVGGQ